MPRYIEADALNAAIEEWFDGVCVYDVSPSEAVNDFQSIVDEQPTVSPDEVRGVVHCKECSHADKDLPGAIYCTMWDAWEVPEDGFCYKGAKMEVTDDA